MKTPLNGTKCFNLPSIINYCFSIWLSNRAGLSFILLSLLLLNNLLLLCISFVNIGWFGTYEETSITIDQSLYLFFKQNIGMKLNAIISSNLTAPLVLVDLHSKILVRGLLFFLRGEHCVSPTALGCDGPALIEIVSAGLSAVLHFCSFQKQ